MTFHLVTQAKNLATILNYLLFVIIIFDPSENFIGSSRLYLAAYTFIQGTISSCLDYCNGLLSGPSIVYSSHSIQSDLRKREIRPYFLLAQNLPMLPIGSFSFFFFLMCNSILVHKAHCVLDLDTSLTSLQVTPAFLRFWTHGQPQTLYSPAPLPERLILKRFAKDFCGHST